MAVSPETAYSVTNAMQKGNMHKINRTRQYFIVQKRFFKVKTPFTYSYKQSVMQNIMFVQKLLYHKRQEIQRFFGQAVGETGVDNNLI